MKEPRFRHGENFLLVALALLIAGCALHLFSFSGCLPLTMWRVQILPEIYLSLSVLGIVFTTLLTAYMSNKYIILQEPALQSVYFFCILLGVFAPFLPEKNLYTMVALPSVAAFYHLFASYKKSFAPQSTTLYGFFLGVAALFVPPLLWGVPLLVYTLYLMHALSMRNFLGLMVGLLLPFWFVIPTVLLFFPEISVAKQASLLWQVEPLWSETLPLTDGFFYSFVTLLTVVAGFNLYAQGSSSRVVTYLQLQCVLYWVFFLLLLATLFAPQSRQIFWILIPFVSILCAKQMGKMSPKGSRVAMYLLSFLFGGLLLFHYLREPVATFFGWS
jgi:hypothetical protein